MIQPVFYAIDLDTISLPARVMPWAPTYSPDGKYILFHDYNGGKEWMLRSDGTGLECITGNMEGRPDFLGGFYYILDDKRMFLSDELGDTAVILECEPNIYEWESYQWMPIDLTADGELGRLCLGRRTYHMAPDGKHLAYNILCPVGLVMVICTLERRDDRYVATDYYCLNPHGPESADDPKQEHWCNGGTLAEFKAFCDGGKGFLFVTEGDGGNIDQYHCDFATGNVTRLSFDPDWDEDGACSPDGRHTICASWRHMGQLDVLNRVPGSLPLNSFYLGAVIAVYYVSSYPGFSNDLQPWLDDQPLSPYHGGRWITVNNIAGHPMWHPDSTKVLLQERIMEQPPQDANERVLEKGMAPNRLYIAKLRKAPTNPLPTVETQVGTWAKQLSEYTANADFPGKHILRGKFGGTANLTIVGDLLNCKNHVVYQDFSNDGINFLSGTEIVSGNPADLYWQQQFTVKNADGIQIGTTDIALHFLKKNTAPTRNVPPMTVTGYANSIWNGVTRQGIPSFGPKPSTLPKPSPLNISVSIEEESVELYIWADIYGKTAPVCGAEVQIGDQTYQTGESGKILFKPADSHITIKASAGNNFYPALTELYL